MAIVGKRKVFILRFRNVNDICKYLRPGPLPKVKKSRWLIIDKNVIACQEKSLKNEALANK